MNDRSSALSAKSSEARTARSNWMLMMRLVSSTAPLGSLAMRCAQAMAWSSTSSSGQTWLTRPMAAARSAGMRSPVSAYSLASCRLVSSGHTTGPPSAATRPSSTCGIGQMCARRHEHDVGEGDEAAAEPDRRAVDGGDDRQPAGHHAGHDLPAVREGLVAQPAVLGQLVEVGEVPAGGEGPPGAREHRHPRLGVGVELREQRGQARVQHVVGGVEVVGPVQRDDADGAVRREPAARREGRRCS